MGLGSFISSYRSQLFHARVHKIVFPMLNSLKVFIENQLKLYVWVYFHTQ